MNIFRTRKFFTLLLYFFITFFLMIVMGNILYAMFILSGFGGSDYFLELAIQLSAVATGMLFILLSGYYLRDIFFENWKRLKFSKHFFLTVIGGTVLLYLLSMAVSFIVETISGSTNPVNQEMIIESMALFPILNIISVAIIAPISEEIVFRFAMIKFKSKYKYLLLIISSLIFGLLHIHGDYIYLFDYALSGFIMGFIYLKTENIWYPIAIHFLNNLLATIGIFIFYLI